MYNERILHSKNDTTAHAFLFVYIICGPKNKKMLEKTYLYCVFPIYLSYINCFLFGDILLFDTDPKRMCESMERNEYVCGLCTIE